MQHPTRQRRRLGVVDGPQVAHGDGPVRTCVGCRRRRPRHELARLARTPDGVRYDPRRRAPGRGANLCPDTACIEAASERGAGRLRRALRGAPEAQVTAALDALRREITEQASPLTHPGSPGNEAPDEGAVRSSRT